MKTPQEILSIEINSSIFGNLVLRFIKEGKHKQIKILSPRAIKALGKKKSTQSEIEKGTD